MREVKAIVHGSDVVATEGGELDLMVYMRLQLNKPQVGWSVRAVGFYSTKASVFKVGPQWAVGGTTDVASAYCVLYRPAS